LKKCQEVTEQVYEAKAPVLAGTRVPVKEAAVDAVVLQQVPVGTVFAQNVVKEYLI
jgi:hypothetical protein